MKHLLLIISLFTLASCNDALRTRVGKCSTADNRFVECAKSGDALSTDEDARKRYIAEVTIPIVIGKSQLILNEDAHDIDEDDELICELDVAKGTQFNYTIQGGKLILRNGITLLTLTKTNGSSSDGILGTWSMSESEKKVKTITELQFTNHEEVRMRKVCDLK